MTLTSVFSFLVNLVVVAVFVAAAGITPQFSWFFLLPLIVELYVFVAAISVILATVFVRFRDVGQVWELAAAVLFTALRLCTRSSFCRTWAPKPGAALPVYTDHAGRKSGTH